MRAKGRFSEDDYKATILEPKLEELGYPHRNLNFCTRGASNSFKTWSGSHEPDYIFWYQGKPILDVEAKPRENQFESEAYPQATFHARNFVPPGATEVQTIPYIFCAAGERMEMFKAVPAESGIDIRFESLPRLLSWKELVQWVQPTLRPTTAQQVSQTTLGIDALVQTFSEIYTILSRTRPGLGNVDKTLMVLNEILLRTISGEDLERICASYPLSRRASNQLYNGLSEYPLQQIQPDHLAYSYRKFITRFFKGESAAFGEKDIGRYLTPAEIIDFMVKLTEPKPEERVIDFACGSGGFLGSIARFVNSASFIQNNLFACDADPFAISTTRTFLHLLLSLPPTQNLNIYCKNALVSHRIHEWEADDLSNVLTPESFDLVISNPPGGDRYLMGADEAIQNSFPIHFRGKRLQNGPLFVVRAIQLAKVGGRICLIVPVGILANEKLQYVRDFIDGTCEVRLAVSLPRVFPNVPSKMSILLMERVRQPERKAKRMMAKVALEEGSTLESELNTILEESSERFG